MKTLFTEEERRVLKEITVVGREWDSIHGRRKVLHVQLVAGKEMATVQTGERSVCHVLIPVAELEKEIAFETK